jgi:hypothetical protein
MATSDTLRTAARKRRKRVLQKHGYQCYWCKIPLVLPEQVPEHKFCYIRNQHIYWREDPRGPVQCTPMVTLDHLKPLREGGDSSVSNLVPACTDCNGKRDAEDLKALETPEQICSRIRREWRGRLLHLVHPNSPGRLEGENLPAFIHQPLPETNDPVLLWEHILDLLQREIQATEDPILSSWSAGVLRVIQKEDFGVKSKHAAGIAARVARVQAQKQKEP